MRSSSISSILIAAATFAASPALHAAADVAKGHGDDDQGFKLDPVPLPAINDAAAKATFTIIDGQKDGGSGDLSVLSDGKVPTGGDQPSANFFFGSDGGRIGVTLGAPIFVKSVDTYSWHDGGRGPQVYKLYASDGKSKNFNAEPKRGTDPKSCGWQLIADVDTRPKSGPGGGQHGVEISNKGSRPLGQYSRLLFDIEKGSKDDPNGNTFFSEIDVVDSQGPTLERIKSAERIVKTFKSSDKKFTYILNTTKAPELTEWSEKELIPMIEKWYPKLIEMLPSDGYKAPDQVTFEYKTDMGGTPAYAAGNKISLNAQWFPHELKREAKGCVVHEMGHVVQNYWRANQTNRNPKPTPGWITEGTCDYMRWYLFEPESKGCGISPGRKANYSDSYRTTANFLDWVVNEKDKDLLKKLNAAAREGKYEEKLWKDWTGMTVEELDTEWKKAIEAGKREK